MIRSKKYDNATRGCVFVTGVWKPGNHLVYSALNELGVPGPFNGIAAHLVFGRHAWAKRMCRGAWRPGDAVQVGLEINAFVSGRYIARQARRLSGRIMGGHAAHSLKLENILRTTQARTICIRRDPRDILVSFADWIGGRPDFFMHQDFVSLSREERVALLLHGGPTSAGPLLSFPEILARGAGWLNAPGVFQVSFEDLIGTAGGGSDELRNRTMAELHTYVAAPKLLENVDMAAIYGGSLTFNQGRRQRWRELNSLDLIDEITEVLCPHLAIWGYAE